MVDIKTRSHLETTLKYRAHFKLQTFNPSLLERLKTKGYDNSDSFK